MRSLGLPVCREALLGLTSRPLVAFAEYAVLALVVGGAVIIEYGAAVSVAQERAAGLAAGSAIMVAGAGERGSLSVADCIRLEQLSNVESAGWYRTAGSITYAQAPDLAIRHVEFGGGLPGILDVDSAALLRTDPLDHALGSVAASQLGLRDGSKVRLTRDGDQAPTVGRVAHVLRGPRAARFEGTVATASAREGRVEECWLEMHVGVAAHDRESVRGLLSDGAAEYVGPLTPTGDALAQRYANRESRFAFLATIALGTAVLVLRDWAVRADTATYRGVGTSRAAVLLLRAGEQAIILSAVMATATCGALLAVDPDPSRVVPTSMPLASATSVVTAIAALGTATTRTMPSRRVARQLKDR